MRPSLRRLTLALAALCAASVCAHAHFVWIHVRPETARFEVLFGDGVFQDTDPTLVRYVADVELKTKGGAPVAFAAHAWGLDGDLPAGCDLLVATQDMGVFDRPGAGESVKLDYDSKGAATVAAAARALGMATEIVLAEDKDDLIATVLFRGEPAPGAIVFVPRFDAPGEDEVAADAAGAVRFARPAAGVLHLRARVTVPRGGEVDGKAFTAEHHYAMLTVSDPGGAAERPSEARQRLEDALRWRARLPEDVTGLAGVLVLHLEGEPVRGEFEVSRGALVQCDVPGADDATRAFVARHVEDLVVPLVRRDLDAGALELALEPRDGGLLGRRIVAGDDAGGAGTAYRVLEGRLLGVERTEGAVRTRVEVLAHAEDAHGRFAPEQTARLSFDARTGALLASETVHDAYVVRDGLRLPATRRVLFSGGTGDVRSGVIELRNLEIERAQDAAAAPVEASGARGG